MLREALTAAMIAEAIEKARLHQIKPAPGGVYWWSPPVKRVHPRDMKRDSLRTAVKKAWIGFLTASGPGAYLLAVKLTRSPCR